MTRRHFWIAALLPVLMVFALAMSPAAAQDTQSQPTDPGTTQTQPSSGIDWRWLLPILAIPVLYLLLRGGEASDDTSPPPEVNSKTVGAKGGKAQREYDEDQTPPPEL